MSGELRNALFQTFIIERGKGSGSSDSCNNDSSQGNICHPIMLNGLWITVYVFESHAYLPSDVSLLWRTWRELAKTALPATV